MQIDRRITNGLAWAGAVLVVAIPVADFAIRQFSPAETPQLAVVQEEPQQPEEAVTLPTSSSQRPAATQEPAEDEVEVAEAAAPAAETVAAPDRSQGDDPVDSFIQSGRELPSYISGGGATTATQPTRPASMSTTTAAKPVPATPTPSTVAQTPSPAPASSPTEPTSTATSTTTQTVTFPTPVSQRPAPVVRPAVPLQPAPVASQPVTPPALIVDEPDAVVTANDLDEWETGPLSEFLANRRGGQAVPEPDYDSDGFFLDEGPSTRRQQPRALGEGFYYPFSE